MTPFVASIRARCWAAVPAENVDIQEANAHDTKLVIPLVLAVVLVILCGLAGGDCGAAVPDRS